MARHDSSGAPTGPDFRVTRRGYDRAEVDQEMARLASRIADMEKDNNRLRAELSTVGLEGGGDLRSEIEEVTADIGRVLQAAREAAEGLRARAAEDAANWRQAAQTEAIDMRRRAQEDAEALRRDAWQTGTGLLEQVQEEAGRIRATAEQDAILTRAEAEQEAHRLTSSARKEVAEEARLARLRSERVAEEARAEAERVMEEAHREAEAAQERVRALEQRRAELMREIEAARSALTAAEADLEAQRSPGVPEAAPPEAAPEEPPAPVPAESWSDTVGTVRIVSQSQRRLGQPVDADAMADEVRRLRARRQEIGRPAPEAVVTEPEPEPVEPEAVPEPVAAEPEIAEPEARPEPVAAEPEPVAAEPEIAEPEARPEPVAAEPEPVAVPEPAEPEPEPVVEPLAVPEPMAAEPEPESESEPESLAVVPVPESEPGSEQPPEPEPEPAAGGPAIDDLFARLRGGGAAPAAEAAPAVEPAPEQLPEPTGERPEPVPPSEEAPPAPEPAPRFAVVTGFTGPDPFELRDRLLLPVTNRALRDAKRAIVDLQNLVLEELRTRGTDFEPVPEEFRAALASTLGELAEQSRLAGALAAAELTGAEVPRDVGGQPDDLSGTVAGALRAGVADVIQRAAVGGGGPRQTAAAVSRLFRAWRTDEAERQVRSAALAAYHGGLLAALESIGVAEVEGRPDGRACAECPAGTGERWPVGGPPPAGTVIPPARVECACTVVPAGQ